jgi:hypothetical protein
MASNVSNTRAGKIWKSTKDWFMDPFGLVGYFTEPLSSSSKTKKNKIDNTYDTSDYLTDLSSSSTGGTGGYYTLDISDMLKAYRQQADADKSAAKQNYDTTRSDLLTSLKRFQEENAKNQESQKQSYLSGQSSLESAREQADRQTRISAASRGLGGSGLQQLAQLQNLINQGQEVSNLATENQSIMDKLRTALTQKEEDTDKALANANTTYENALKQINATLASNVANAAAQRANSYVAPSGGSSSSENIGYANSLASSLSALVRNYQTAKKGTSNTTTYKESLDALDQLASDYTLSQNSQTYQNVKNNLIKIYQNKHNGKKPKY